MQQTWWYPFWKKCWKAANKVSPEIVKLLKSSTRKGVSKHMFFLFSCILGMQLVASNFPEGTTSYTSAAKTPIIVTKL